MIWRAVVAGTLLAIGLGVSAPPARAVESDPLPVPTGGPREQAVTNAGVKLLLDKKYGDAQKKIRGGAGHQQQLAEAHNNLAFSLRMQSAANRDRALKHYDRALALKPKLAQAYMYRGVLFLQQGDMVRARQDLERLRRLDAKLASDLERVVEGAGAGSDRGGIAAQYE